MTRLPTASTLTNDYHGSIARTSNLLSPWFRYALCLLRPSGRARVVHAHVMRARALTRTRTRARMLSAIGRSRADHRGPHARPRASRRRNQGAGPVG